MANVRTDAHRPGAIIPANYRYVLSYNGATMADGWPIPSFGINCEMDRRVEVEVDGVKNGQHSPDGKCCIIGLLHVAKVKFAPTGSTCKCSICGANFVYGDVWVHEPTQEYIHLGHTCADKYEMLADRSEHELALGRLKGAAAKEVQKKLNAEEREAFLAKHPGLGEALKTDHRIIRDIAARFQQFRTLSDKQVALVVKIAAEAALPPEQKEKNVPAPITEGRQTFVGTVVSAKSDEGPYGTTYKMTVKVSTPGGVWLAWGTCPAALLDQVPCQGEGRLQQLRGRQVEVTARLTRGRDAHFALMNRPLGRLLESVPAQTAV